MPHSPQDTEDDESSLLGRHEMVRRGNDGPRSLDFFLQNKEKKRRGDGPREEFTVSIENEKARLDKIRRGEIVLSTRRGEMERLEPRQRTPRAVSPRRGQSGRQRELILSPLAYHSQMSNHREQNRTWEGKWIFSVFESVN